MVPLALAQRALNANVEANRQGTGRMGSSIGHLLGREQTLRLAIFLSISLSDCAIDGNISDFQEGLPIAQPDLISCLDSVRQVGKRISLIEDRSFLHGAKYLAPRVKNKFLAGHEFDAAPARKGPKPDLRPLQVAQHGDVPSTAFPEMTGLPIGLEESVFALAILGTMRHVEAKHIDPCFDKPGNHLDVRDLILAQVIGGIVDGPFWPEGRHTLGSKSPCEASESFVDG
jgi:hypothetical protein